MLRRVIVAAFAAAIVAPAFAVPPASAVVLFSCTGFSATSFLNPGLGNTQADQAMEMIGSSTISSCSNGRTGTIQVGGGTGLSQAFSFPPKPLGCPVALGGAAGNDYPNQTPILLGADPSFKIDWNAGTDSVGITKVKSAGPGTPSLQQFRLVFVISAGQFVAPSGQKTKVKGLVNWVAGDTFNCANNSNRITQLNLSLPGGGAMIAQQT